MMFINDDSVTEVDLAVMLVCCPACAAMPGERCDTSTHFGRVEVLRAAKDYVLERGAFEKARVEQGPSMDPGSHALGGRDPWMER